MDWNLKLARRCAQMARSTVREFLKHTGRPGVISFAGGLPAPELFPVEAVRAATERVLLKDGARALQYGQTEGLPELREHLAGRFGAKLESVLITSGGQQALDLIGRVLLDEGDRVLVENPTYLSLLSAWRPLGVTFRGIELDANGLATGSLCDEMQTVERPKILYCMPNFQNPSGITLSADRRRELAEMAASRDLVIVEDDAYGALRFEGAELPSLYKLTDGQSIYVGTFSKVLAPGFRVGWIVGPPELTEVFARAKQAMDLQTGTFNQSIIMELLRAGVLERQVPLLCAEYKARRDRMLALLTQWMPPGVSWTVPRGGMFLLLKLPAGQSGRGVSRAALERDVLVVPGEDFHVHGGTDTLRLNFTNTNVDTMERGIQQLAAVLSAETGGSSEKIKNFESRANIRPLETAQPGAS